MYINIDHIDASIQEEVLECDREYGVIRRSINKQPGYMVDWELVAKA